MTPVLVSMIFVYQFRGQFGR
jgi:uncharacterized protein (DUF433 family)